MALRTAEFVREFLGLSSKARVYELARQGAIPCVRIVRQVRFDEEQLREWALRGGSATQRTRRENGGSDGNGTDTR